jgi:N-acetylglucosamine kinase-like BadF-type ATPase
MHGAGFGIEAGESLGILPEASPLASVVGEPVSVDSSGASHASCISGILADITRRYPDESSRCIAAVVGASGILGLSIDRLALHHTVEQMLPQASSLIVSDAVTATIGALGGRAGAACAAGTGAIAMGTDLRDTWVRVDGWGHLLGDEGSGSWLGRNGLQLAFEAFDGRRSDCDALYAAATSRFGSLEQLPQTIYTSANRATLLASFARDVIELATQGDERALALCRSAARKLAQSTRAALVEGVPLRATGTGGILHREGIVYAMYVAELSALVPGVEVVEPYGSPLTGAQILAHHVASCEQHTDATGIVSSITRTRYATFEPRRVIQGSAS